MRDIIIGLTALACAGLAAPALAEDAPAVAESDFTLSGNITAVSDYRFRGVSLSSENPAVQPTLTLSHSSGFYVGVWGSNLDDTPVYGEVEVDLYAGWTGEVAKGTTIDAAVLYYYYPDGSGASDYFEPYVSIAQVVGPVTAKGGISWAPSAEATGNENLIYVYGQLSGEIPHTPLTLTAKVGHQSFGGAFDDYWDYSIGVSATFGPVSASLSYMDTNIKSLRPNAYASEDLSDGAIVATIGIGF